jgi:serine/threonine protein phosphatase 1
MRTFVLGDLHGAYKALKQCLDRSRFDYQVDHLIFLGDVADGWSQVPECIEELSLVKHLVVLKGNHDIWLERYLDSGEEEEHWFTQGGEKSAQSYQKHKELVPGHLQFLKSARPYYLDSKNRLFIHAGFNPDKPVEKTNSPETDYFWSREVYMRSFISPVQPELYFEIYIGHTPTLGISDKPVQNYNVWLMDQGAGWNGYLSLMDIDNKDLYQSDCVRDLYPDETGRN